MSISSEITRLSGLRDTIRTKLVNLGIITDSAAKLSACSEAIDGLSLVTPSIPATTVKVTPTISAPTTAGVVTVSGSATASVTPTTAKGYTKGTGTAGTIKATASGTKTITTLAAKTYTPKTTAQTIKAGRWLTGAQTIAGDANLVAANIVSGKSIFGVSGSLVPIVEKTATVTGATYSISDLYKDTDDYAYYYLCVPVDVTGITPRYIDVRAETYDQYGIAVCNGSTITAGYFRYPATSGISHTHMRVSGTTYYVPIYITTSSQAKGYTTRKFTIHIIGTAS